MSRRKKRKEIKGKGRWWGIGPGGQVRRI